MIPYGTYDLCSLFDMYKHPAQVFSVFCWSLGALSTRAHPTAQFWGLSTAGACSMCCSANRNQGFMQRRKEFLSKCVLQPTCFKSSSCVLKPCLTRP